MLNAYKNLRECVHHNPLGLSLLPKKLQGIADKYLPYSTGIEIECSRKDGNDIDEDEYYKDFADINNRCIHTNPGYDEQRFRIPTGIEGMILLYDITEFLKKYYLLNEGSGIHYHISMDKVNYSSEGENILTLPTDWILKELDTWKYKGRYNRRAICVVKEHVWLNFRSSINTAEFRIGEMTFDYSLMMKRIIHCQSIITRFTNKYLAAKKEKERIEHGQNIVLPLHQHLHPGVHGNTDNL